MEIKARNVNVAFSEVFWRLKTLGLQAEPTRNGPALVIPEPVMTTYEFPNERVLFSAERDANPIFHLMESIWMLAGRRDVAFLTQFNRRMSEFSDDGVTYNAAYGYRWRSEFGLDQLVEVIELLRHNPTTRQAVVQIWRASDLVAETRDKACNTQVVFEIRRNRLNMTVFNRSNDIWWGAYGANAVHFSVLQEFVASAVGVNVGVYRQISNNLHLYTELYDAGRLLVMPPDPNHYDFYSRGEVRPLPLMLNADYQTFLADCARFCDSPFEPKAKYSHPFFEHVARPMALVSRARRDGTGDGREVAQRIRASDWRRAVFEWIARRSKAK